MDIMQIASIAFSIGLAALKALRNITRAEDTEKGSEKMPDFISEWLMSGWIGDNLRQAVEDGFFESGEELAYFVEYAFAPLFLYFLIFSIIIIFCTKWLVRFGLLLIDLLCDVIRRKKQPPFNRKV